MFIYQDLIFYYLKIIFIIALKIDLDRKIRRSRYFRSGIYDI